VVQSAAINTLVFDMATLIPLLKEAVPCYNSSGREIHGFGGEYQGTKSNPVKLAENSAIIMVQFLQNTWA
jgi:hypothetical protein